jgi:hypothetical protein
MQKIFFLAIVLVCSSCSTPHRVQLGGESGIGNKTVSAKVEPGTLVAVDGTICTVPAGKFHRTKSGDRVWCNWRPGG